MQYRGCYTGITKAWMLLKIFVKNCLCLGSYARTLRCSILYSKGPQLPHTQNDPKDWFVPFTLNLPHSPTNSPVFPTLVGSTIIYLSLKPWICYLPLPRSSYLVIKSCIILYISWIDLASSFPWRLLYWRFWFTPICVIVTAPYQVNPPVHLNSLQWHSRSALCRTQVWSYCCET